MWDSSFKQKSAYRKFVVELVLHGNYFGIVLLLIIMILIDEIIRTHFLL